MWVYIIIIIYIYVCFILYLLVLYIYRQDVLLDRENISLLAISNLLKLWLRKYLTLIYLYCDMIECFHFWIMLQNLIKSTAFLCKLWGKAFVLSYIFKCYWDFTYIYEFLLLLFVYLLTYMTHTYLILRYGGVCFFLLFSFFNIGGRETRKATNVETIK